MPPQPSERALAWLAARGVTAGNKPLGRYNADKAKSDKEYINDDTFDTYPNEYEFFKDKMIVALWASAPYNAEGEIVEEGDDAVTYKLAVPKTKMGAATQSFIDRAKLTTRPGDGGIASMDEFFKDAPTNENLEELAKWLRQRVLELGLEAKYEREAERILQQFREFADVALMVYAIWSRYKGLVEKDGVTLKLGKEDVDNPARCRPVPKLTMDFLMTITGKDEELAKKVYTTFNEKPVMPRDLAGDWINFRARERKLGNLFTALNLSAKHNDDEDRKKFLDKKKRRILMELKDGAEYIEKSVSDKSLPSTYPFSVVPGDQARLFPMQKSWDEVDYLILLLFGCPPTVTGARVSVNNTHFKGIKNDRQLDGPLEVEWFAHMGVGHVMNERRDAYEIVKRGLGRLRDQMLQAAEQSPAEFEIHSGMSVHLHVANLKTDFFGKVGIKTVQKVNANRLKEEVGPVAKTDSKGGPAKVAKVAGEGKKSSAAAPKLVAAPKGPLVAYSDDEDEMEEQSSKKKKRVDNSDVEEDAPKKKAEVQPTIKASLPVLRTFATTTTTTPAAAHKPTVRATTGVGLTSTEWVRQSLVPGLSSLPTLKQVGLDTKEDDPEQLTFVEMDASVFDIIKFSVMESQEEKMESDAVGFVLGAITDHYRLSRVPIDYTVTNEDGGSGAIPKKPSEPHYVDIMLIPSTFDAATQMFTVSQKSVDNLRTMGGMSITLELKGAKNEFSLKNVDAAKVTIVM